MYIDQDTFVEAADYQIPAEAIMAPSTIPPTVFRGFESNLVSENDQAHAMLTDTFAKILLDVGFAPHIAAAIISEMPMQRIVDAVVCAETRERIEESAGYKPRRGFTFGRRLDTMFKDIGAGSGS